MAYSTTGYGDGQLCMRAHEGRDDDINNSYACMQWYSGSPVDCLQAQAGKRALPEALIALEDHADGIALLAPSSSKVQASLVARSPTIPSSTATHAPTLAHVCIAPHHFGHQHHQHHYKAANKLCPLSMIYV